MQKIIYIHVPKCGGSSFGAALRLRCLSSQGAICLNQSRAEALRARPGLKGEDLIEADYAQREIQLCRHLTRRTRCIAGHVRYSPRMHRGPARDYAHVTLLRDPVERFVSHYRYLQRRHPDPARAGSLAEFLDSPDAARIASQYLFYFSGHSQVRCPDPAAATARAIAALRRFALIGDLSRPAPFAARLLPAPLQLLRRNRAPSPGRVPPALRPRIEALCAHDITIYRAALALPQAV